MLDPFRWQWKMLTECKRSLLDFPVTKLIFHAKYNILALKTKIGIAGPAPLFFRVARRWSNANIGRGVLVMLWRPQLFRRAGIVLENCLRNVSQFFGRQVHHLFEGQNARRQRACRKR